MPKFYKTVFFLMLMTGSLITMSSYSWMMMWLGLEINIMAFIPLIHSTKSIYTSESALKYFMVQTLASTMMIFSMTLTEMHFSLTFEYSSNSSVFLLMSALMMKLGMAPFHYWFPEVMEGLSWMSCLLLLTWQKVAPMSILMLTLKNSALITISIILSSLLGSIMGLNQISLRKILTYSSINHMSWMLLSMSFSLSIWLTYFIIYSITNMNLIMIFKKTNIYSIIQLKSVNFNLSSKMIVTMNMLSLAGLPPFIGFIPKWLVISQSIINNQPILPIIIIITTLMAVYFYLQITFPTLFLKTLNMNLTTKIIKFNLIFLLFNFTFIFSMMFSSLLF